MGTRRQTLESLATTHPELRTGLARVRGGAAYEDMLEEMLISLLQQVVLLREECNRLQQNDSGEGEHP